MLNRLFSPARRLLSTTPDSSQRLSLSKGLFDQYAATSRSSELLFSALDKDSDGLLSREETKAFIREVGEEKFNAVALRAIAGKAENVSVRRLERRGTDKIHPGTKIPHLRSGKSPMTTRLSFY